MTRERADAFVTFPGGIGTLEEVIEQMTWKQLGHHSKPILLANIKGFWDSLCALLDHMGKLAFIRPVSMSLISSPIEPRTSCRRSWKRHARFRNPTRP